MSNGVEFEEDTFGLKRPNQTASSGGGSSSYSPANNTGDGEPAMVRWLMRRGWVKTHAGGQGVLIAIVIINIIVTFIVIKFIS